MDILSYFATLVTPDTYTFFVLPILIFLCRIGDVSIGTIRVIFISKGFKFFAPILGFFEILIWLSAIQQIMIHLDNTVCFIAYAAGFSSGTFIGMLIEEKLSIGKVIFRIIARKEPEKLIDLLREAGYSVTVIDAQGPHGNVKDILVVLNRHEIKKVVKIVKDQKPGAFYTIEDIRYVSDDGDSIPRKRKYVNVFGFYRKGK